MIRVNNIKVTPCERFPFRDNKEKSQEVMNEIKRLLLKKIRISEERIIGFKIAKQSIDARKKDDVKVVFSVDVKVKDEGAFIKKNKDKDILILDNVSEKISNTRTYKDNAFYSIDSCSERAIVVGAGPAGLMCALRLAEAGLKPLLLERGEDVDSRIKTVNDFWQGKPLDPSSNVQFGEGGAGTFSDGKLNSMVKDENGRMSEVYRTFVRFGADESILYINKPHIGTDKLTEIVKNIRKKIIELGGEVRFSSKVENIIIEGNAHKKIKGVVLSDDTEYECDTLVLALGHSARDTFEMLEKKGIAMEQKPFAIGVRVQHPRDYIDSLQYGVFSKHLPTADYKLTYTKPGERSVYSFCMCPGGYVVNASSERGRLAVNGMSYSGRDSDASNSAIVVQVNTTDFPGNNVLAGMWLQRKIEEDAFNASLGKIPVQYLEDFGLESNEKLKRYFITNNPICKGEWEFSDLNRFLPDFISEALKKAFPYFGNKMKGFDSVNTLLLGLESRTSSPVRILRGENLQSINTLGLYPCGEGAGYAGGITSAAMDGLKVADKIIEFQSEKCLYWH